MDFTCDSDSRAFCGPCVLKSARLSDNDVVTVLSAAGVYYMRRFAVDGTLRASWVGVYFTHVIL